MTKIAFISCTDLSRFFPSERNNFFTHDDQLACDFLQAQGMEVKPVTWGSDIRELIAQQFDLFVIRSPWDYFDSNEKTHDFLFWLGALSETGAVIANSYEVVKWNIDKHYLQDLSNRKLPVIPMTFLEKEDALSKLSSAMNDYGPIVIKPCISAAAKDTFVLKNSQDLKSLLEGKFSRGITFEKLREGRDFIIQPFLEKIEEGEWSCVFFLGEYSHSVLKIPQKGSWLVQDELGGSVLSIDAPANIKCLAQSILAELQIFLNEILQYGKLLYARIDIMPGNYLGEVELIEPELFFLDRNTQKAHCGSVEKFHSAINRYLEKE